jgi:hypothetical protein
MRDVLLCHLPGWHSGPGCCGSTCARERPPVQPLVAASPYIKGLHAGANGGVLQFTCFALLILLEGCLLLLVIMPAQSGWRQLA